MWSWMSLDVLLADVVCKRYKQDMYMVKIMRVITLESKQTKLNCIVG